MRFIPTTFMQSGEFCVKAEVSGTNIASGSFVSGSETWLYYEFGSGSLRTATETFQLEITQGYTTRARFIVIGGGGGGGWNGLGTYGTRGGGGGAGDVKVVNNGVLYPGIYSIQKGRGGTYADADNPTTPTYNGGTGAFSEINGGVYVLTETIKANGGEGGFGDESDTGTRGDGGDSGAGYLGGQNNSDGSGGGAGATEDGFQATNPGTPKGGEGGDGVVINLPYTSPTFNSTLLSVGGGGGGTSADGGVGVRGGGDGSGTTNAGDSGDRYTGGGGGGGADFAYTPPNGQGTQGGDGVVIVMFPTGSCSS